MTPTTEDQIALEKQAITAGYEKFMARMESMKDQGQAGETEVGLEVQYLLVREVSGHLQHLLTYKGTKKGGRPPRGLVLLRDLDVDALAAEALSAGWTAASRARPLTETLGVLGRAAMVHAEVQAIQVTVGQKKLQSQLRQIKDSHYRAETRAKALSRKAGKVGFVPWSPEDIIMAGGLMWNALCLTGLFETWSHGPTKFVGLTTKGEHLALEATHALAWARPSLLPTIVPPKPWKGLKGGAYFTPELQSRVALVRTRSKEHRSLVSRAIKDGSMAKVIEAVNLIQGTPFSLRPEVVSLVEWAWKKGLTMKKFPRRHKLEVPALPWDMEYMGIEEKAKTLARHYKLLRFNRGITSNAAAMRRDLETAKTLMGYGRFWLPVSLDYRGRVYPIPSFNHQRSDHVAATFQFADGKPLGTSGLRALKWHVANSGDFGKVSKRSWDERVAWTEENMDLVRRVAKDPRENLEWTKADKPFAFYHACLDLVAALDSGNPEAYVSRLPVGLDGSNSGVQHYSAALRAEEGALVNLTPQDTPADLYSSVAAQVHKAALQVAGDTAYDPRVYSDALRRLTVAREKNDKEAQDTLKAEVLNPQVAALWLQRGIDRSVVKRPTMTRVYGSEAFGFRGQIMEDLMEPLDVEVMAGNLPEHPFGPDGGRYASTWIASRIWEALSATLGKTSEGMDWLQDIAVILATHNLPVAWNSPVGFPVLQRYEEVLNKEVRLWLYDRSLVVPDAREAPEEAKARGPYRRYHLELQVGTTGEILRHRQKNAVAPNFVHSLDAAHLMLSVLRARDEYRVQDFLLVHDSFATHASMIEDFGRAIREAMVDMYSSQDPFHGFLVAAEALLDGTGATLPEPPEKGLLDLQNVLVAPYTFS
jgi:DNA-directed RNA polymerase